MFDLIHLFGTRSFGTGLLVAGSSGVDSTAIVAAAAAPVAPATGVNLAWVVLGACLALLAAAGVWLIHESGQRQRDSGTLLLCLALAGVAFFAVGFAFAMGGVSGAYTGLGPLPGLGKEWMPRTEGWGILGRQGFFLSGAAYDVGVYALFLFQAALMFVAVNIAVVPWAAQAPRLVPVLYTLLFAGLLYPMFANWVWGGGWLAHLGLARDLGHGFVDFAGSGVVNAVAGLAALGAFLALRPPAEDSDVTASDVRALSGLGLATAGWIGIVACSTYAITDTRLAIVATNALIAMVTAATVSLLYTWFVAGEPYVIIGAQAGLAGLVAIAAGAPFFPAWTAAVVGGIAGLLVPFGGHLLARITRSKLAGSVVAVHGLGGIWGLLAVGLMADGRYGIGWNGIGERDYLGITGLGVSGSLPGALGTADPSQLTAQLAGVAVLLIVPIVTFVFVAGARAVVTWRPPVARIAAEPIEAVESEQAGAGIAEAEPSIAQPAQPGE